MRRPLLALPVVTLALLAGACGSQGSAAPTTVATTVTGPTASATQTPAPTSSATTPAKPANASVADLEAARVPPYCGLPAQALKGGRATGGGEIVRSPAPVLADVNADGALEAVGAYRCTAGGRTWPEKVLVVGAGGALVASYDLAPEGAAVESTVTSLAHRDRAVDMTWRTTAPGVAPADYSGTLRVSGGQVLLPAAVLPTATPSAAPSTTVTATATVTAPAPGAPAAPPTPAGPDTLAAGEVAAFATPSGNTVCTIGDDNARCDVIAPTFTPPPKPASCEYDWGHVVGLTVGQAGAFRCYSDFAYAGGDAAAPRWWQQGRDTQVAIGGRESARGYALGYGHRLSTPNLSCVVAADTGVTCTSLDNAHGFTVSRGTVRTW